MPCSSSPANQVASALGAQKGKKIPQIKAQPTGTAKSLVRLGVGNATAGLGAPPQGVGSRGGGRSTGRNSAVRPRQDANATPSHALNIQTNSALQASTLPDEQISSAVVNLSNMNSHSNKNAQPPKNKALLPQPPQPVHPI